jgi:hypothetical protein
MPVKTLQAQAFIKIDVIEWEERESPGERSKLPEIAPDVCLVQVRSHARRHRTSNPLVEITDDDAGAFQIFAGNDAAINQLARLLALFEEAGTEVHIENVDNPAVELNIGPQAATPFTTAGADVEVLVAFNGKACQQHVPITPTLVLPILSKCKMESKFVGYKLCLILFRLLSLDADNFLKRNDIRMHFPKDADDTVRTDTPIHATAFVDVIGNDANYRTGLTH